jgi:hypothetical protein
MGVGELAREFLSWVVWATDRFFQDVMVDREVRMRGKALPFGPPLNWGEWLRWAR